MPKGDKFKLKADPEDGTTPIANLLLEAVAISNLNGTEKGIILYLWRQTYGWLEGEHRLKEATLGQDSLAAAFSTSPRTIYSCLKSLADKKIIVRKDRGSGKGYIYRMNTRIADWNSHSINLKVLKQIAGLNNPIKGSQYLLPSTETSRVEATPDTDTPPLKKTSTLPLKKTSGATLYKEILNKYLNKVSLLDIPSNEHKYFLCYKLCHLMLKNNPKVKMPENLNPWINEIRLMIEADERTPEEILQVIDFSQNDSFWKANILSAGKLRKQFDQLSMRMKSTGHNLNVKGVYHGTNPAYKPQPPGTSEKPKYIDGDAPVVENGEEN